MVRPVFNNIYVAFCNVDQNIVGITQSVTNHTIQVSQRILTNVDRFRVELSYGAPPFRVTHTIFQPDLTRRITRLCERFHKIRQPFDLRVRIPGITQPFDLRMRVPMVVAIRMAFY